MNIARVGASVGLRCVWCDDSPRDVEPTGRECAPDDELNDTHRVTMLKMRHDRLSPHSGSILKDWAGDVSNDDGDFGDWRSSRTARQWVSQGLNPYYGLLAVITTSGRTSIFEGDPDAHSGFGDPDDCDGLSSAVGSRPDL
jgi:hypothetical protein